MFIISATLNNSVERITGLVEQRDRDGILTIAGEQINYGADALDICCCRLKETELEDTCWLVDTIQAEYSTRFCIDSPEPEVQRAALSLIKNGRAILDSTTLEQKSIEAMAPIAKEFNTELVVLLHDEAGMPGTTQDRLKAGAEMPDPAQDRLRLMSKVEQMVRDYDLKKEDLYLDPLVFPLSTDTSHWYWFLQTVRQIRTQYPEYHISGGLDNGSYGLPKPELLNLALLSTHIGAGGDTVMLQLTPEISAHIKALKVLQNEDAFCSRYLKAYRKGLLDY